MSGLKKLDTEMPPDEEGVYAFAVVRNELSRLRSVLHHHKLLGVERFFIVDNASSDGTRNFLLSNPKVHVFTTDDSYREFKNGMCWIEELLNLYGIDRWCLLIDADEYFIYPGHESIRIGEFCKLLEDRALYCLVTMFLDMYGQSPILQTHPAMHRGLLEICPFFDMDGYANFPAFGSVFPRIFGGPRQRLFWPQVTLSGQETRLKRSLEAAFDETFYFGANSDVSADSAFNGLHGGLQHYTLHGQKEGRLFRLNTPPEWPEDEYLDGNADVKAAVDSGQIESGLEHYLRFGQFERRFLMNPPLLTQIPLLRWQVGMKIHPGRHIVEGVQWHRNDAVGGALLHFKLMSDLLDRAKAVKSTGADTPESPHWASENARYLEVLKSNTRLSPAPAWLSIKTILSTLRLCNPPISVRYRGSQQLVDLGLMTPTDEL